MAGTSIQENAPSSEFELDMLIFRKKRLEVIGEDFDSILSELKSDCMLSPFYCRFWRTYLWEEDASGCYWGQQDLQVT